MAKKLLIDATHAEETRVVVVDGTKVDEFDFETIHKRQLAGNIYLAKITRVEPSLQAAFVDYGGNRHGFLAFAEIHPDYYQIPVADRKALLDEERAAHRDEDEESDGQRKRRRRDRGSERAAASGDASSAEDAVEQTPDMDAAQTGADIGPDAGTDTGPDAGTDFGTDIGTADSAGNSTLAETTEAPAADTSGIAPQPARIEGSDAVAQREIGGMAIVDLDDEAEPARRTDEDEGRRPYRAADHASDNDDQIESVGDDDVSDEVRPSRRPRSRRYKIQEVIKVRQIMLVQVVKEERGNKGAALTTYLSLAGRYCVLMPNTARGGGISRKITNAADRKKLKEIAGEISVPEGAGLIIRTAGANRTKQEIRRDYEYLFRLWEQIRDLTLKSIAPAPIYEEGNLIKRSIRDLYSKDIDEVIVEGDAGFRTAQDFMKMIMPTHAKSVRLHADAMPLFAKYQVESYLAAMFNPVVHLKSGGYIVIGITEALVAIDVNSGKSTREGSIEDTALKTNLEAADEIARQLRLRDLAGLIVIDFIDMEERKNNASVEKRLKDRLADDRARIQMGRISAFGLMELSRQRLRPGMLEATTQPCPHCHGTGLIRSDNSIALAILRALEEEGTRNRSKEVLVKAPVAVINYLFNAKREHLAQIELRYGMAIRLEADPTLVSPNYHIEKFKIATRVVAAPVMPVVSLDAQTMSDIDDEFDSEVVADETEADAENVEPRTAEAAENRGDAEGEGGRRKRRRRRRKRGGQNGEGAGATAGGDEGDDEGSDEADSDAAPQDMPVAAAPEPAAIPATTDGAVSTDDAAPKRKRTRTRRKADADGAPAAAELAPADPAPALAASADPAPADSAEAPAKPKRSRRKPKPAAEAVVTTADAAPAQPDAVVTEPAVAEPVAAPMAEPVVTMDAVSSEAMVEVVEPAPASVADPAPEPAADAPAEPAPSPDRPRRSGWWSRK